MASSAGLLWRELLFGATVCNALATSYTADKSWDYQSDIEKVRRQLAAYLAEFDQ